MKKLSLILAILAIIPISFAKENQEQFDSRMQWFDEAKFGMFIHWGSYSTLKGIWKGEPIKKYAEWIQANADIPKEEYAPIAKQFNPSKFNADEWIRIAKEAGMKYFVITSKHHEGFCLWDSKYTEYDIKDASGVDRDLLGELSAACKKYGVKFGTYYSIIDWHHPTQKPRKSGNAWNKWGKPEWASPIAKDEYVKYMKAQLKELVDLYDTQIFWFDGDWWPNWSMEDGEDLYAYLRQIQPNAIINNRVGKRDRSKIDFGTPENFTPGSKLDYYWEACWTINHSWGYKEHDKNWKTTKELVQKLVAINSKGGNLLLNIGPTAEGEFPHGCLDRLAGMGDWLKAHSEAIYKTNFPEVPLQSWGRVLQRGNNYYFHVFEWPKNGLIEVQGMNAEVESISLMNSDAKISAQNKASSMTLTVPKNGTNPYSSVIKLVAKAKSVKTFDKNNDIPLRNGDLLLLANKAKISGKGDLRFETKGKNLGYWTSTGNIASWNQEVVIPGKYEVIFVYASKGGGSTFELRVKGQKLSKKIKNTGSWTVYKTMSAGTVNLPELTNYNFKVKMVEKKGEALFNLKSIILRPKK
ncbi:alpha-L-fucosidase [Lentisphaera marina]|uniref:alpha-L-fucosidase n=1 Tax=Lentisphaera marina TaxID=1111041 RepID=UPI002366F9B5|nr:alpha-L-fucosidase [Lentisphaera marina]MDD7983554.1 alpha-L-fucosidase [Lentisphaera marina]